MINFICDGCHRTLQIGNEWAGKLGHCPYCRTNSRVPGYPKRTSKLVIIARIPIYPLTVLGFWSFFLSLAGMDVVIPFLLGGLGALAGSIFFCWAVTNLGVLLAYPHEYWIWRRGGGDPFFDSLPPLLNNDPSETRYQELYREKARLECEQVDRMFGVQPKTPPPKNSQPDLPRGIDDPNCL